MGRLASSRSALVAAVVLLIILEVFVLYVLMPGRWRWAGVSPDSVQYICYGLSLPWVQPYVDLAVAEVAIRQFGPEGFEQTQCSDVEIINTVFARLVTPALIGLASLTGSSTAIVLPSILLYVAFSALWFAVMAPRRTPVSASSWLWILIPLSTPALATQLPLVLTEGPLTLAYVAAVVTVLGAFSIPKGQQLLLVLSLGIMMLLSRQSWPLVAFLWASLCFREPILRWLKSLPQPSRVGLSAAWISVSLALAASGQYLIGRLTERPGTTTTYYSEVTRLVDFRGIGWSALRSISDDIISAINRLDLVTLGALVWAIWILLTILRRGGKLAVFLLLPAWLLGFYQTGLVVVEVGDAALGTNFRYFVPAFFATLAAYSVLYRRPHLRRNSRSPLPNQIADK